MKFCSELPFEKNVDKKYSTIIEKKFSKNKELSFFKDYLLDTWGIYFKNKSLKLVDVKLFLGQIMP